MPDPEEIAERAGRPGYLQARARIMRKPERSPLEKTRGLEKTARRKYAGMAESERASIRERAMARSPHLSWRGVRPPGAPRLDRHGHPLLTQGFKNRNWRRAAPGG